ncbi:Nn.00g001390.m01.CDS01 [Neocucurbitaria sp. VM-36]
MEKTPSNPHKPGAIATETYLKPLSNNDAPAQPLLPSKKIAETPSGWPTSPKRIKSSVFINVPNDVFDILLLALSVVFLASVLVVNRYDQNATVESSRITRMLLDVTNYVSLPRTVKPERPS